MVPRDRRSREPASFRAEVKLANRRTCAWGALAAAVVVVLAWASRDWTRAVEVGGAAPDFEVFDPERNPVTLTAFADKVVLLNIWATWCEPCREEMPSMQRLYEMFPRDRFEIAAVSVDRPLGVLDAFGNAGGDPVAFARELNLTFPILLDPSGEIQRTYRTTGVPESFLIGADGIVYKKMAGSTEWDSEANAGLVRRLAERR